MAKKQQEVDSRHYDVILSPHITEKSTLLSEHNAVVFKVAEKATKPEIKAAVEALFDVKVTSVNTLNRQGKTRRTRFGTGKRADTKRAIVSLAAGERIDIFGGPVS